MEKIVETKTCKHCNSSFEITDKDLEFYDKVSPIFGGKKYNIPTPSLCPDCRRQRRLSWRNESKLYKNKCLATGKNIVSIYSIDKKFKIYEQDYWWSDKWDPKSYGRDFDFKKTFFEQFKELQLDVPRIALLNGFQENAEYANHAYGNKNSYLVNSCGYLENSFYCINAVFCNYSVDCYNVEYCDIVYELIDCKNCSNSYFLSRCLDCNNCYYCEDCVNCKNCIGCKGLINKENYIFNKKVSKDEYELFLKNISKNKEKIFKDYNEIKLKTLSKGETNINCLNIVSSDRCSNSKNIKYCFECNDSENLAYSYWMSAGGAKDSYDFDIFGENSSLVYDVHCGGKINNVLFSNIIWGGYNNIYCDLFLLTSSNCFGCIGLHNNENYCILNKQYTKQEYEKLVPQIIEHMMKTGEWGEFFPSSLSPFGYNETVAQEWFTFNKEEVIKQGFKWSDYEPPFPKVEKIIPANKLPDSIADIPDDILNWAIECEVTKKPFRIIAQELEFYRKHNLPIPRRHPDQRHLDRMALRNPRKLFDRKCDKCGKDMKTTYNPERKEIVYCEECYNREVY